MLIRATRPRIRVPEVVQTQIAISPLRLPTHPTQII